MKQLILVLSLAGLWPPVPSWAQLYKPNATGVSLGQWSTIVRDVNVTKKFWIGLGGTPITIDGTDVIKFPGVLIFLTEGTPSGGSDGVALNHIGFGVRDVREAFTKWNAAGLKTSAVHQSPLNGQYLGDVYTPDNLMIEITEEAGIAPYPKLAPNIDIESNHMHFWVADPVRKQTQSWYVKNFGAQPAELRANLIGDIPGVKFIRWGECGEHCPDPPLPTKGRALDHIGFEVKNLAAFCKKLEANGVKLDAPYSKSRHKSFASAALTDPLETSIELTEGLNRF